MKVLFIAGAPASGKDTAVGFINEACDDAINCGEHIHEKFAAPLRDAICGLLDLRDDELEYVKRNDRRIRQLMIGLSELVVKPTLGEGYFGTSCAERVVQADYGGSFSGNVVISDSGFDYEVAAFIDRLNELDSDTEHEFQMWHLKRPGCDFSKDSRSLPEVEEVPVFVIENTGSMKEFGEKVSEMARKFFNK